MYAYLLYFAEMHVKQGIFELAPAVEREIESDILHNLQLGDHAICMYVCMYVTIVSTVNLCTRIIETVGR
jgi:hypothetical protein